VIHRLELSYRFGRPHDVETPPPRSPAPPSPPALPTRERGGRGGSHSGAHMHHIRKWTIGRGEHHATVGWTEACVNSLNLAPQCSVGTPTVL